MSSGVGAVELFQDLVNTDIYNTLNAPNYPLAQASRLCGISTWRVSSWLRGYEYRYRVKGLEEQREGRQEGVVKRVAPKEATYVSFLELIDLLFVKRFLEYSFSLQEIRKFLEDARMFLETPHFASSKFLTSGKSVFLDEVKFPGGEKGLIELLKGGQRAFPEIIEPFGNWIDFEDISGYGLAERWYPNGKKGFIVVDPKISFGQPTVIGTRITTENIFDLYIGEKEKSDRVSSWFDLPVPAVNSAVAFEQSIHA